MSKMLLTNHFLQQLKLFHSELLAQLEQKLELDIKYLTVSGLTGPTLSTLATPLPFTFDQSIQRKTEFFLKD